MLSLQLQAPMPARLSRFNQTRVADAAAPRSSVFLRLQSRTPWQQTASAISDDQAGNPSTPNLHHTQQQLLWRR